MLRLPRNRGAISATNRSAETMPLKRMVRSISPVETVAVRTVTVSGCTVPEPACSLTIHTSPAMAAIAMKVTTQRFLPRGSWGWARRSSGLGAGLSGASGAVELLGTKALLMLKWHAPTGAAASPSNLRRRPHRF